MTLAPRWRLLKGSPFNQLLGVLVRGGSRTAATSKMEHFGIIVNGWKPLTIITKSSILDVAAVLDPPLLVTLKQEIDCRISLFKKSCSTINFHDWRGDFNK